MSRPMSPLRERMFTILAIFMPFLLLGIVEAGLRLGGYRGDTRLFIERDIGREEPVLIPNPNFAARYFFYTNTIPSPSLDVFLAEKPANGFRVFAMGGSTAAGYPYGFNGMFSRVVRDVLTDVMPDREVEVVNVATSAINTYTLLDQLDEILAHDPDAILIYSGHNEYYGALGVGSNESIGAHPGFVRLYLKLQRLKVFMAFRDGVTAIARRITPEPNDGRNPSGTLMERIVAEQTIPLGGELYHDGRRQFESNLAIILSKAREAGVAVYIGSLASNLQDQPPFISTEAPPPSARSVYDRARTLAEAAGTEAEWDSVRALYTLAKDLDALRFRAPKEFNDVIHRLADEHGARYVPVEETLAEASPNGIIGGGLMLEHLHPNDEGYFLMGRAFAQALADDGFLGMATAPEAMAEWQDYRSRMFLSEYDLRIAWHRVELLKGGWPFVSDPSRRTDYRRSYRPFSVADSIAFRVVHDGVMWDEGKVGLAEHFTSIGSADRALMEYNGLIRNQPWNPSPYLFSARLLLDRGRFAEARPYLESAYRLDPEDAFVNKMLGSTEVNDGNLERGILLLEKAIGLAPSDPQSWYNLSGAYALSGRFDDAIEAAKRVQALNPAFPGLAGWMAQLESLAS